MQSVIEQSFIEEVYDAVKIQEYPNSVLRMVVIRWQGVLWQVEWRE